MEKQGSCQQGSPQAQMAPLRPSSLVLRSQEVLSTAPSEPGHNVALEPTALLGRWEGEALLTAHHPSFACPQLGGSSSLPHN